jgi:hypothetical protein
MALSLPVKEMIMISKENVDVVVAVYEGSLGGQWWSLILGPEERSQGAAPTIDPTIPCTAHLVL